MKKICTLLVAFALILPISLVNAQVTTTSASNSELTIDDVKVLAPQLIQVLSTMNSVIITRQNRYEQENRILRQLHMTLETFSDVIDENSSTLTDNQIDLLADVFDTIGTSVESISDQREQDAETLDAIFEQIEGIVEVLVEVER